VFLNHVIHDCHEQQRLVTENLEYFGEEETMQPISK
jgi:hypothetical protein